MWVTGPMVLDLVGPRSWPGRAIVDAMAMCLISLFGVGKCKWVVNYILKLLD